MLAPLRSLVLGLTLAACGGDGGAPPPIDRAPDAGDPGASDGGLAARYFPLAVGVAWSYQVIDGESGATRVKRQEVLALEAMVGSKAGITAYRLQSERDAGFTVSWQEDTGAAVLRHREESYDAAGALEREELYRPGKLRLDETPAHLAVGASYLEDYEEDVTEAGGLSTIVKAERWTVEAVDEIVEVPAGRFACLRLARHNDEAGSMKRFWFARGIGKVKEEGAGQTELLAGYELP